VSRQVKEPYELQYFQINNEGEEEEEFTFQPLTYSLSTMKRGDLRERGGCLTEEPGTQPFHQPLQHDTEPASLISKRDREKKPLSAVTSLIKILKKSM